MAKSLCSSKTPSFIQVIAYESEQACGKVSSLTCASFTTQRVLPAAASPSPQLGRQALVLNKRRVKEISGEKVKGHSDDRWNDRADSLADRGAKNQLCRAGRFSLGATLCREKGSLLQGLHVLSAETLGRLAEAHLAIRVVAATSTGEESRRR